MCSSKAQCISLGQVLVGYWLGTGRVTVGTGQVLVGLRWVLVRYWSGTGRVTVGTSQELVGLRWVLVRFGSGTGQVLVGYWSGLSQTLTRYTESDWSISSEGARLPWFPFSRGAGVNRQKPLSAGVLPP